MELAEALAELRELDRATRFETSSRGRRTRKLVGGPRALTTQMLRMIDLIIGGHDWDPTRTPLDPYAAGAAVGYRRKAVRHLVASPLFEEAYWRACEGESNGGWTPTFEEVRQSLLQRDRERQARKTRVGYALGVPGPRRSPVDEAAH
jgi:hypothetical protein